MTTVLVDYGVGNLHSAEKALARMADEVGAGAVIVSDRPEDLRRADRVVLPGDGAFPHCAEALNAIDGLREALDEAALQRAVPFLGICVGMQLMATTGHEHRETPGLGYIPGHIRAIEAADLKVPHMGWNDLELTQAHPVLEGISTGDHAYFVHSYAMQLEDPAHLLARCDYGGPVTALIGRDTMVGAQFHPEKSQSMGLRLLGNFLSWAP